MTPEIFATDPDWPYTKAKTAVLTAASAVIREEGPRAATLKNIASRAGITEPAIFRHFDGVDGLFEGLFSVYERISSRLAVSGDTGLSGLRAACSDFVDGIAASRDFAYILVHARHVFRGYPELKARVVENDAAFQGRILAFASEAIAAGELRSDIDASTAAISVMGAMFVAIVTWIESEFGFDLPAAFAERWDDIERLVASKPAARAREAKAGREKVSAWFPLRPAPQVKAKSSGAAKQAAGKRAAAKKAKPKAVAKPASRRIAKEEKPARRQVAAKAVAKKPTTRSK
jgi:TetR/AcrR family transcriptional regulator, fatty acid metabolism regulator protein